MFRSTIILLLSKELIKLRVLVIAQAALDSSIEASYKLPLMNRVG